MRLLFVSFFTILFYGCGGGSGGSSPSNSPPNILDPGNLEVREGDTEVGTITATDPEGSLVTFSLSAGADSNLFSISSTGTLVFGSEPDFENPQDSNGDNVYEVIVLASDGQRSSSRAINVVVLDNIEGRLVDAPIKGATVWVDLNADGIHDSNEQSTLTNDAGYFVLPQVEEEPTTDVYPILIASGGTDTATDVALSNFLLAADLPEDSAQMSMITPLTFVLMRPSDPSIAIDSQGLILEGLGIGLNVQEVLSMDVWDQALNGDEQAKTLQRINQQLAVVLQGMTAATGEIDDLLNYGGVLHLGLSNRAVESKIDLTNVDTIRELINPDDNRMIDPSGWTAISSAIAMANTLIASGSMNPTESSASAIVEALQTDLVGSINSLRLAEITVTEFESVSTPEALFEAVPFPSEAPNNDGDGLPDDFDPDDDNDGARDTIDAFPFDPTETTDTDSDGIGNNADTDDDGDGVEDESDFYPLISLDGRLDTDNDGRPNDCDSDCELTGMASDEDDDNDGVNDDRDDEPLDDTLTPPTAKIFLDVTEGNAPLRVSFNASASLAGNPQNSNDVITSILWDTGDLDSASAPVVSEEAVFQYIYLTEGTYDVSLTVTNSDGYSHTVTAQINISAVVGNLTVSGAIVIPDSYFVDSDVNDSGSSAFSNDNFASSQRVFNPSIISGYANVAGQGPDYDGSGNTYASGDRSDLYFFSAAAGDVVNLISGDPTQGDLDIGLYDAGGTLIDYSVGYNTLYESVTVPSSGGWYIEVYAYSGASTYLLEIGGGVALASHGWNGDAELATGQLLADENKIATALPSATFLGSMGVHQIIGSQSSDYKGPHLYKFNQNAMPLSELWSTSLNTTVSNRQEQTLATLLMAKKMGSTPYFKTVQPNFMYRPLLVPDDELYQSGDQWHYDKIRMPEVWDETTGTGSTVVAIIDTGIRHDHPDISASISADSYDFISDTGNAGDGDGIDNDPSDPGDGTENPLCVDAQYSSSWHGTHVGGTVGATTNNATGVAGINWDVELMDLRVLGCYGGSSYDIQQSILYAAGLTNSSGQLPSKKADVINMSLGGPGYDAFTESVIQDARNEGVIVIAASGNGAGSNFPGSVSYPASYEGVVSVGATTQSDTRASFSTYNEFVDIAAPGVGIWSTIGSRDGEVFGSGYAAYNGTSMATPHVAGVVSLMRDIFPAMTPLQLDASIASELLNDDVGDPGYDNEFGYGRLDAFKAVETAEALANGLEVSFPARLSLSTDSLNFGVSGTEGLVSAYNAGDGTLNITSVQSSAVNVVVTAPGSSDGLGDYTIVVDRGDLGEGIYQETVQFISDANTKDLAIQFEVFPDNIPTDPNAGRMQAFLYDVNSENVYFVSGGINAVNGEYSFVLNDIPPAVYSFITGTDMDNDGQICGNGEACAIWPNPQEPDFLIVNQAYSNLSLTTEYQAEVTTISREVESNRSQNCVIELVNGDAPLVPACIRSLILDAMSD